MSAPQMKTPADMQNEKMQQVKMWEEQLSSAKAAVDMKLKNDVAIMKGKSEAQKKQYCMQVDMETSRAEGQMKGAAESEKMGMMQQVSNQKAALEQSVLHQTMAYEKQRAEMELESARKQMAADAEKMQKLMNDEVSSLSASRTMDGSVFDKTGIVIPAGVPLPQIRGPNLDNLNNISMHAGGLNLSRMPPPINSSRGNSPQ